MGMKQIDLTFKQCIYNEQEGDLHLTVDYQYEDHSFSHAHGIEQTGQYEPKKILSAKFIHYNDNSFMVTTMFFNEEQVLKIITWDEIFDAIIDSIDLPPNYY